MTDPHHPCNIIAGLIEQGEAIPVDGTTVSFNMSEWVQKSDCGTLACIAGHAIIFLDPDGSSAESPIRNLEGVLENGFSSCPEWNWRDMEKEAAHRLGVPPGTASHVFYDTSLTPMEAAHVLRRWAEEYPR